MSTGDLPALPPASPSPPPSPPTPVPLTVQGAHRVLRFLWTSNPFYVISAGLFLIGLQISFSAQGGEIDSWALSCGLAGYTLLLAAAGLLLVRFARVWNDVRTVLLPLGAVGVAAVDEAIEVVGHGGSSYHARAQRGLG